MALLDVMSLTRFEDGKAVVDDLSFQQGAGQRLALIGSTGSGKTSLLKMIGGLLQPSFGAITFDGEMVQGPNERLLPGHLSIAYLSQHFELRNHYRVKEVLAMASQLNEDDAIHIYEVCRIEAFLNRWTHQLSGGEKQRVALARLLVGKPKLLLLDEPFSNLDLSHKAFLKQVLVDLEETMAMTFILISHDPTDVLPWAHEVLVMKDGRLVQKAAPNVVYRSPVDEYTAGLLGDYILITPGLSETFNRNDLQGRILRPDDFALVGEDIGVPGEVSDVRFMGSYLQSVIMVNGGAIVMNVRSNAVMVGQQVCIGFGTDGNK